MGESEARSFVFIGTMNAMPMMYAFELKRMGYRVAYVVDVPPSNTLSRPENHYPGIEYPYPDWIIELRLPTQLAPALVPRIILQRIVRRLEPLGIELRRAVVVTSGFHHRLLDLLPPETLRIALSYGADLDSWAYEPGVDELYRGMRGRSFFRFLTPALARKALRRVVQNQYAALARADGVIYFARGLNPQGDHVTDSLEARGVQVLRRHDVSYHPVAHAHHTHDGRRAPLFLLSPVRFLFSTFVEGCKEYDKGNDRILEGVARFKNVGIPFELHVFEKGDDVRAARELIARLHLEDCVVWHPELPFSELLKLYEKADVVFDQLGSHWIGASGIYALYLGIPLIANIENLVQADILPREHPIAGATNAEEVCQRLVEIAKMSKTEWSPAAVREFALKYFGPERIVTYLRQRAES